MSPSNLSQNIHVNRLQASTSFEMLPITPTVIPEEKPEQLLQKKCAASQTTDEDAILTENSANIKEGTIKDPIKVDTPTSCRCPNCNCPNCAQDKNDLEIDDDDAPLGSRHSVSDEDSGTESFTHEESRRKLSVSSFAKSSASVLIHSCFVSEHSE